jgi:hypothetical protein
MEWKQLTGEIFCAACVGAMIGIVVYYALNGLPA